MRRHTTLAAALAAVSLLVGACAGADAAIPDEPAGGPAAGTCPVETPDCVDADLDPDDLAPEIDVDAARADAERLLGQAETDLPGDVRVARRGDEHFMLTEDYVVGRLTVELDQAPDGTYRVTAVAVELPDGPERFS
jgi:hypothetical protein